MNMATRETSISVDYEDPRITEQRSSNVMTIKELSGAKRVITLSGTSMPKQGATWGMDQRVNVRWPAGSPESTQQVLGATQNDSAFTGIWKRTWLGRVPVVVNEDGRDIRIVYPATMRDLFFDILQRASLLEVTWLTLTRMGRLVHFDAPHDRKDDISWNATFAWINSGNLFPYRMVTTRDQGVKAEVQGLLLITENLTSLEATEIPVNVNVPRPPGTPELTLGQVSALLNAPKNLLDGMGRRARELTNKLKSVADLATQFKNMPASISNSVYATAENIVATCNQFHDEFTRTSPEQATLDRRVSSLVQTANYYSTATKQTEYMAQKAADLKEKARRAKVGEERTIGSALAGEGDLLALHLVRVGDTLAGISFKYYGTSEHAIDIAKANKLNYPIQLVSTADGHPSMNGKTILGIPRI